MCNNKKAAPLKHHQGNLNSNSAYDFLENVALGMPVPIGAVIGMSGPYWKILHLHSLYQFDQL